MDKCASCNATLDKSNPAHVRCVNTKCSEVMKCHCCKEPLGQEISEIVCYICKELHCMYCDKDSFSFDVKWKEKQICKTCEELDKELDMVYGGWGSEPEFEYPNACQMNDCLGLLSYEGDYAVCLECNTKWYIEEFLD